MTNPSPFSPSSIALEFGFARDTGVWEEVSRLCRRICVLEEQGENAAAEEVRTGQLAECLSRVQEKPLSNDESIESRVEAVFRLERDRVANAAVLADLLAPRLREMLAASVRPMEPAVAAPREPKSPPRPAPETSRRSPGDIAGFIDEMIALERSTADAVKRGSP